MTGYDSSMKRDENYPDTRLPLAVRRRRLPFGLLIVGCFCLALCLSYKSGAAIESTQESALDFSKFAHTNQSHQRLPCLLCHRRETSAAQPVRSSQHTPCAGCHAQQFSAKSGPICTICHTNVEAKPHDLKPFPSLRTFNLTFAHAKHRNVACSTCHSSANRGVALSIPAGSQAHTICFQCHSPRAQSNGRDISSCSTCHKAGSHTRISTASKAFKANFSHDEHKREGASCLECHTITNLATRSSQVSSPLPTEHPASQTSKSCETCHNDKRAFGIASFANCKRCHQGTTFRL